MITAWSVKFSFEERERALMMAYFLKGHLDPSDADAGGRGEWGEPLLKEDLLSRNGRVPLPHGE